MVQKLKDLLDSNSNDINTNDDLGDIAASKLRKLATKTEKFAENHGISFKSHKFRINNDENKCDSILPHTKGPFDIKCLKQLWIVTGCTKQGAYYLENNGRILDQLNQLTWFHVEKYIQLLFQMGNQGSIFAQMACFRESLVISTLSVILIFILNI